MLAVGFAIVLGQGAGIAVGAIAAIAISLFEGSRVDPERSFAVLASALVASQVVLLAIAVSFPIARRAPMRDALGLAGAHLLAFVLACTAVLGLAPLSDFVSSFVLDTWPHFTLGTLTAMEDATRDAGHVPLLLVVALAPAIAEEIFFRGLVQRALGRTTRAALLASLLFAVSHFDPPHVAGILPIAFLLGWLASRSGSTLVTVGAHLANNAAAVVAWKLGAAPSGPASIAGGLAITAVSSALFWLVTRPPPPERRSV
jgi:membrane protease YdiL (CAAX protease family)